MRDRIIEAVENNLIEVVSNFETNEEFQQALEKFITNHLAISHYIFSISIPKKGNIYISPKKFWFPASYFICGKVKENGKAYFKMHYINEQFCHDEFYERDDGRRHPAIVLERSSNGQILMVPFTNSSGDGKLRVKVTVEGKDEVQFATYKFNFNANEEVLDKPNAEDFKGRKISDSDFDLLLKKTKEYIEL